MPPSQLKRLKSSLREQGVTGGQKSKKQKKAAAHGKNGNNDRVQRNVALQSIRESFNPFEYKAVSSRPAKFQSTSRDDAGGKYKQVLHRPGVSKSMGEQSRRATLLPEMQKRNKVGGLVDRRIGEGDTDMTPEERAAQRFAMEKSGKAKKGGMFDLEGSDDEGAGAGLTHGGRRLEDLAADDFGEDVSAGSESEGDDGGFLKRKRPESNVEEDGVEDELADQEDGDQPQRKKTKQEVMKEVIAKSKLHKYERQKAKEDDDDLRDELDLGMQEMMALLQGHKVPTPASNNLEAKSNGDGPTMNPDRQRLLDGMDRKDADKEYDTKLRQLAQDTRAQPSDKTLTAEEKAEKEAARLKELEEKRTKRMRGEDVSDDEEPARRRHDAEDEGEVDKKDEEEIPDEAAEFGFTSSAPPQKPNKGEQLVLEDEDEFALDGDLIASGSDVDVDMSEESEGEESEAEADPEDQRDADEDDEFIKGILGDEGPTGANDLKLGEKPAKVADSTGLAFTYPCPRTHSEMLEITAKVKPSELPTIVQRIRALHHPSLSSSNKESMSDFSAVLVDHVAYMAYKKQPLPIIEQLIRHLHSLSRTYPETIANAFRKHLQAFHERGQPEAGDLIVLTAIGSIYPTSDHFHQVVTPAITLMARWLEMTAPTTPEVHATGILLVRLSASYQQLSKRFVPETLRFTQRALAAQPQTHQKDHANNIITLANLWKDIPSFHELFQTFTSLLPKKESRNLQIMLANPPHPLQPLQLHHHRAQPIRTSIPKFEESFNPDKHYDPDKERTEANKLQKEYKRERKGALRELRKDANFIARQKLGEKREADAAYEKKYRKLIAEVQNEEGAESKQYEREKRMRKGKK
ncbi:hypothetical protein MBLNU230_g4735t1 [Neophaeotheca triangularis]